MARLTIDYRLMVKAVVMASRCLALLPDVVFRHLNVLNNHRLKAGGLKVRTESPDTGR